MMKRLARVPRAAVVVLVSLVAVVALLVGSFPLGAWLHQRAELRQVSQQLAVLRSQNRQLASQAARLRDSGEIRHIARQQYGLVPKGTKAYVILPSAPSASGRRSPTRVGAASSG